MESLTSLQMVELEILKVFIDICEKLGLSYYLVGGSCLGAIRHQGFIPWDDDIDIAMTRKDYDFFIKHAHQFMPDYLFLQNYHTDSNCPYLYTKIRDSRTTFIEESTSKIDMNHGIFIDVFPLDYYPDKPTHLFKLLSFILTIRMGVKFDIRKSNKLRLLELISVLFFPSYSIARLFRESLYKHVAPSNNYINYFGAYGDKEIHPLEVFGEGQVSIFEGVMVTIPSDYDYHLSKLYGDYMKLPPIDKRHSHHNSTIVDINNSYKKYTR